VFKLGKQVETALMALKELHENPKGVSISAIAEKNSLSKNTLSKLLQTLMSEGHLVSAQGVKGGYKLVKPLQNMSFYELLNSLDEIKPLMCSTDIGCALEENCQIQSPLKAWEFRFMDFLKETSVLDLINEPLKTLPADANQVPATLGVLNHE
jgi:Rrf2 family protein